MPKYFILATPLRVNVEDYLLMPEVYQIKALNKDRALLKIKKLYERMSHLEYEYEVFSHENIETLLLRKAEYEDQKKWDEQLYQQLRDRSSRPSVYNTRELESYLNGLTEKELRSMIDDLIYFAMSFLRMIANTPKFEHPFNKILIGSLGEVLHNVPAAIDEMPCSGTYKTNMVRLLVDFYHEIKPYEDIYLSLNSSEVSYMFDKYRLSLIKEEGTGLERSEYALFARIKKDDLELMIVSKG